MTDCHINKFLLFISCYNVGVSPSILNLIDFFSARHHTTVLLFNASGSLENRFCDRPVDVVRIEDQCESPEGIAAIRQLATNDSILVACDPHGFALAMLLYPDSRPYYYSLELYMSYDHFGLDYQDDIRSAERSMIDRISGLIIQSIEKDRLFREDYRLEDKIPSFLLPVTCKGPALPEKSAWLREKYGIKPEVKIALALGGIREWYASIELALAFSQLDDWVLIFHGFSSPDYLALLHDTISKNHIGNVLISCELLDDPVDLTPMVQSCDIGIAWYADISIGFRVAGRSSGKIATYLRHGLPVITSRFQSTIDAIENPGCGVCITAIDEIPDALERIQNNFEIYAENARLEYDATYNFDNYADALSEFLGCHKVSPLKSKGKAEVLLAVSHFWPSVGGLETIAEQLAEGLVKSGFSVSVLTFAMKERCCDSHLGAKILSVDPSQASIDILAFTDRLTSEVTSGKYSACVIIQDPLGSMIWAIEGLIIPPHTRIIIQPIINAEGYDKWKNDGIFSERLASILRKADAAVTLTCSGLDDSFMRSHGVLPVYIPNAVEVSPAPIDFRKKYHIPESNFLMLHVANIYHVKNHAGLLRTVGDLPPGWSLVMIGYPHGEEDSVLRFLRMLPDYPDVLYIPGLLREETASAMVAADIVLLSSNGEGSPVTLLEAMALGKPWLATPYCGAAADNAGGILADLDNFPNILKKLHSRPELLEYLGRLGHEHWKSCYRWERVIERWSSLIYGEKKVAASVTPPHITIAMKMIRELVEEIPSPLS